MLHVSLFIFSLSPLSFSVNQGRREYPLHVSLFSKMYPLQNKASVSTCRVSLWCFTLLKCIPFKRKPLFQVSGAERDMYPLCVSLSTEISLLCCFCNRYISFTCFPLHFFSLSFLVEHDSRVERVSPRCFAIQKDSAT